jgi:cytochrome bd ubiquinol oxidase subunit I
MGLLMLAVSWLASWQLWRRGLPAAWLQRVLVVMSFSGWIAVVAGWYTTEMGRQPWLVHGILRTAEAAAPNVGSGLILTSLAMYLLLYLVLIVAYVSVLFYLARKAGDASPAPEATS